MRSSVVPHTIASETAQKTNWKKNFDSTVASESPMTGNAFAGSPKSCRRKPWCPATLPAPKASANPTAHQHTAAIEKFVRIFATTVPAFLPREKPIARNANPACMNITRQPATITQIELIATELGSTPLLYASKLSADAAAGSARSAPAPSTAARAKPEPLCIRPPEIGRITEAQGGAGQVSGLCPHVGDPAARVLRGVETEPCATVRSATSPGQRRARRPARLTLAATWILRASSAWR